MTLSELRCYSCGDKGHIGKNCPGNGKGKMCYKCHKYGHTRFECHESGELNYKPESVPRLNYSRGRGGFRGSGRAFGLLKRKIENKDENWSRNVKRGRIDRTRGRGGYGSSNYNAQLKSGKKEQNKESGANDKDKGKRKK
ncbi:DNA-binding protein HEXBP-like [Diachasma alloeum]|uniref:DNA-binding protein HEXBP-like n=1 Tax=Diachasma alloeum TaxID=454923 RepID=UPI0007383C3A|nr:DNA-binding protein HEXBP-like [Diachasma alloeum]